MSFYYGDIPRLDWGFENPNRTAALIASLMVACWAISLFKRWGFWVALGIFSALGACLVQTFSRGGVLALLAGGGALVFFAGRPWPRAKVVSVCAVLAALSCYAVSLSATARYASSWQGDPSVTNRLEVWKHIPGMVADAPRGWGMGQSQEAYMQWYQAPERKERFLNLVSLHFTLLAELGWPMRAAYLLVLAFGFLLSWPGQGLRVLATPFGVWTAAFVAGTFTHFSTSWLLYVPPLAALAVSLAVRGAKNRWPQRRAVLAATASVAAVAGAFCIVGRVHPQPAIGVVPGGLIVGQGQPRAWVLVDRTVLGENYGKTLRTFMAANADFPPLGVASDPGKIPPRSTVVVCGALPDPSALRHPRKLVLLNSDLAPQQLEAVPEKIAVFGEFSHSEARRSWEHDTQIIPGAGDFLPSWPAIVFEHLR